MRVNENHTQEVINYLLASMPLSQRGFANSYPEALLLKTSDCNPSDSPEQRTRTQYKDWPFPKLSPFHQYRDPSRMAEALLAIPPPQPDYHDRDVNASPSEISEGPKSSNIHLLQLARYERSLLNTIWADIHRKPWVSISMRTGSLYLKLR